MRTSNIKRIGLGAAAGAAAFLATANAAFAAAPPPDPLNSGDTAWMITSIALVLMMTIPGLALFYGGMVRKKNMLATLAQSFGATAPDHRAVDDHRLFDRLHHQSGRQRRTYIGSFNYLFLGPDGIEVDQFAAPAPFPESVYMFFQMTFAIITPALIAGALADRMKFSAFLWFMVAVAAARLLPDRPLGVGRRLAGHDGRAGLCRRHGRASECRHRGPGHLPDAGQAYRPRHREHGAAQSASTASSALRCCGSAGSASTPVRPSPPGYNAGMAAAATQIATAAAALALDVHRMDHRQEASRAGHDLRRGRRPCGHHAGIGLRRCARRAHHRHRRRRRLLLLRRCG